MTFGNFRCSKSVRVTQSVSQDNLSAAHPFLQPPMAAASWPAQNRQKCRDLLPHPHFLIWPWPSRAAGNQGQQEHTQGQRQCNHPGQGSKKGRGAEWNKKERANDRKENCKAAEPYLDDLTLDRTSPANPNPIYKHQTPRGIVCSKSIAQASL